MGIIVPESEVAQMRIKTLDEALKRINELEKEVKKLKKENEELKNRNFGGRKKHDEAWMASYNDYSIGSVECICWTQCMGMIFTK